MCPKYEIAISCIYNIGKDLIFKDEFGEPLCSIINEDIQKGNISLVSAFANTLKGSIL